MNELQLPESVICYNLKILIFIPSRVALSVDQLCPGLVVRVESRIAHGDDPLHVYPDNLNLRFDILSHIIFLNSFNG